MFLQVYSTFASVMFGYIVVLKLINMCFMGAQKAGWLAVTVYDITNCGKDGRFGQYSVDLTWDYL